MRRSSLCLVALPLFIAGLALPGSATAAIVPGKSIGKVSLGQTEAAVRQAVGKPTQRNCNREGSGKRRSICFLTWKRLKLDALLIAGRVAQVGTTHSAQQTSRGIGVGDRRSALDKAYPSCKSRSRAYCILGRTKRTGDRYTYIDLSGLGRSARIERIAVGRWDARYECALGCG